MYPSGAGNRRHRSKQYINWVKTAGWELAIQRPKRFAGEVTLKVEVAKPKKSGTHYDLTNRVKCVEDLLVTHGIIQGDDDRYVQEVTMRWAKDIEGIRVTVRQVGE